MSQAPTHRVLMVVLCCLSCSGCSDGSAANRAYWVTFVVLGSAVGYGVTVTCRKVAARNRDYRNEWKEEALVEAPEEYRKLRDEITSWIPDCGHIVKSEGIRKRAFGRRSSSSRARDKSLELLSRGLFYATLLHEDDITRETYEAVEELTRLQNCCARCRVFNKNRATPKCLAISDTESVNVEMGFDVDES